jgi:hypothetical protein
LIAAEQAFDLLNDLGRRKPTLTKDVNISSSRKSYSVLRRAENPPEKWDAHAHSCVKTPVVRAN